MHASPTFEPSSNRCDQQSRYSLPLSQKHVVHTLRICGAHAGVRKRRRVRVSEFVARTAQLAMQDLFEGNIVSLAPRLEVRYRELSRLRSAHADSWPEMSLPEAAVPTETSASYSFSHNTPYRHIL